MDQLIQRKDENTLANNYDFLRVVAMGGPCCVAVIQRSDFKIVFVNSQFGRQTGYTNEKAEQKNLLFTDLLDEYQKDRLTDHLNHVLENVEGRSHYVLYRIKTISGELIPYYIYAAPLEGSDNYPGDLYHIEMRPDYSKWDMPFSSFDTRELFLEQFNSEDFGTFEWIMDVDKVFWSVGIYRIYEVDDQTQKVNNLFARRFIHPNDKARVKAVTAAAIAGNEDLNIEFRIITAKQNVKIIHSIARIIRNKDGRPVKFAGSLRDITAQRTIEDDLKNKVEELHHSNRELEEFAYVASHDMQEPLRKITTFSDRLSEKYKSVLSGEGLMYLSRMTASAENMRSLINDLLDFSRISKTSQHFEAVNLNLVLRQVKTELELTIEETKTIINSQQLPTVDAIASQMKQLLSNLISNAIKFHKEDHSPVITMAVSALTEEEKLTHDLPRKTTYYKIDVTDNGIGFENEYATRIFQVFQRLHGKSEYPGSGIGLAICKKILEYHSGIIYAENIPGTGARFTFILPEHQPKNKAASV